MKLEDQVCSLELAQRLKELNVKQESLVYWLNTQHCVHMKVKEDGYTVEEDENGQPIIDKIDYRIELGNPFAYNIDKENRWCAFTVAELGEMLPYSIDDGNTFYYPNYTKHPKYYRIQLLADETKFGSKKMLESFIDDNEANARAKMLIYLIENGLIHEVISE